MTSSSSSTALQPSVRQAAALRRPAWQQLALPAAAGLGLSLLSALPASAHGGAGVGLAAGASHPLLGLDHLLLLLGVGAASSFISRSLLLFALGGALIGGTLGASGLDLPAAEVLAALAVSAVGLLVLQSARGRQAPALGAIGSVVAAAVAVHALLHGQEASGGALWWLGAAAASTAVVGVSGLVLSRINRRWTLLLAGGLSLAGLALAVAPLA